MKTTTNFTSLRQAIDNTLLAIGESQQQVETIARSTLEEVERLEKEYDRLKQECGDAIVKVESLEQSSRSARERLMAINREVQRSTEQDMRQAYEEAQRLQGEVSQWREREIQLRLRRDDVARRLKSLRATANEAEVLMAKFHQMTSFLSSEFEHASSVLEGAETLSLLGLRMLQLQEEERRILATRLHDGPMQSLASVAMRVQSSQVDSITFRNDMRSSLNVVIGELRNVVYDLRPPLLDDLGLVPTLKRYTQQWMKNTGIPTRVQLIGLELALSPTEKVTLFRAIQEGLSNVVDHADATEVDITLTYRSDRIEIRLTDNGVGVKDVDWHQFAQSGCMGLNLCRQRLSAIGGTLGLTSVSGGAELFIAIPVAKGGAR